MDVRPLYSFSKPCTDATSTVDESDLYPIHAIPQQNLPRKLMFHFAAGHVHDPSTDPTIFGQIRFYIYAPHAAWIIRILQSLRRNNAHEVQLRFDFKDKGEGGGCPPDSLFDIEASGTFTALIEAIRNAKDRAKITYYATGGKCGVAREITDDLLGRQLELGRIN